MIRNATLSPDVAAHILDIFARIFKTKDICKQAAVRSSAVGEDRLASFAGQYKTVLNVGKEELLEAYKAVVAGKDSPEALVYRINYGSADGQTPMAELVVEMIDSLAAGVMYTRQVDDLTSNVLEVRFVFGIIVGCTAKGPLTRAISSFIALRIRKYELQVSG